MEKYIGVELIDQKERERQHILTKALWQHLCEAGIKTGDEGRISCVLFSKSLDNANELKFKYQGDWDTVVSEQKDSQLYIVEIITPLFYFSIEALIDLADVLMVSAYEHDSIFDGFEMKIEDIKRKKHWWKFW